VRRNADGTGFGGLTRGFHRIPKPVIAAVNGWALGGALELVLACDIRVASDRARFGLPLVGLGFHTGDGGLARLINTRGLGVAVDLQLTGEPIDAERALQCNLVTRVVRHEQLMQSALELAERIVTNDELAVRSAKQTALELVGRQLDDQLQLEALNGYSLAARSREVVAALGGRP
jgi:enoyl-CoA hydratase/carnithine racemase